MTNDAILILNFALLFYIDFSYFKLIIQPFKLDIDEFKLDNSKFPRTGKSPREMHYHFVYVVILRKRNLQKSVPL